MAMASVSSVTRLGFGGRCWVLSPPRQCSRLANWLPGLESQLRSSRGKMICSLSLSFLICKIMGMVIIPTSWAYYESNSDFPLSMHLWIGFSYY